MDITDLEGTIEYVNPEFVRFTGYAGEEAIGQNPRILKSGKQPPELYQELWQTITQGQEWRGEFCNKKKNGDFYWEFASISPIRNEEGVIEHFVGIKIDITERKRAEEALKKLNLELDQRVKERTNELSVTNEQLQCEIEERRQTEEELRKSELWLNSIFNSLQEAVFVVTPDRKIVNVNDAAENMYGYSREEIRNLSTEVLHIDNEHYLEFGRRINEAFGNGKTSNLEFETKRKNGEIFPTEHTVSLLKNKQGESLGIVSIVRDITDRKRAEEELQKAHDELELRVDKRTADLAASNRQLHEEITERKQIQDELERAKETAEVANLAKSTFLANMSHELRTPLNSVLGFAQILEIDEEALSKQQLEYIDYIKTSGEHLLEMVNDILDLSKIDAGKIEIEKRPLSLTEMLFRVSSVVKSLANNKKIEIKMNIDPDLVIEVDEVRIKQVLYNLLSNAIKFTDPGKEVGIDAKAEDGRAVIDVWDKGIGIEEKDIERVFDPFEQVGRADAGKAPGTGLGLAISKRLIEAHGGDLTVESKIGAGSRFTVSLPGVIPVARKKATQKIGKTAEKTEASKHSGDVLVVEDNEINIKLITAVLERLGYSLHFEKLGKDGVRAALDMKFDLILMDIQLPDISEVEAMKKIREKAESRIPIIALTAYAMKGDEERFLSEGFDGYISKPIGIKNLQETLANY